MDTNELLRKVRKIEIKTKGLSQNIFPLGLQGQGYDLQRGARVPVW